MGISFAGPLGPEVDRTCHGTCSNCGNCCSDALPLTPLDISVIRRYVKKHQVRPISHPLDLSWHPPRDSKCPFFDASQTDGKHCTIYAVRPIICKYYSCQVWSNSVQEAKIFQEMMKEALEQPKVRKNPDIFLKTRSIRYAIWPERFPEYKETQLVFPFLSR